MVARPTALEHWVGVSRRCWESWESGGVQSCAAYSRPDGVYRYVLSRTWDAAKEKPLFVMLNPSAATERDNDPTVARLEYLGMN